MIIITKCNVGDSNPAKRLDVRNKISISVKRLWTEGVYKREFTIEHRRKLAEKSKGNKYGIGNRSRLGQKGKKCSEETKHKIAITKIGDRNPAKREEVRLKISLAKKGKPTGMKHTAAWKQEASARMKNNNPMKHDNIRKKVSKTLTGRKQSITDEHRKLLGERFRTLLKSPDFQRKRHKAINRKPTRPEKLLEEILNVYFPHEYKYVGDGSFCIGSLNPDFINTTGKNIVVEMFGDYWHEESEIPIRESKYLQFNYKMIVVWQSELNNIDLILERLCHV